MERVLFPFESLGFCSPPGQRLQVWGSTPGGAELIESLAVEELESADLAAGEAWSPGESSPVGQALR